MTDHQGEIRRLPPWREGLRRYLEENWQENDILPDEWLYEAFGMTMVNESMTPKQAERIRLRFLGQFEKLRDCLLTEHCIDLERSDKMKGYRIVPAKEQTMVGYQKAMGMISKGLRTGVKIIAHTNETALTDIEKVQKQNALTQLGILAHSYRLTRKCPRLGGRQGPEQIEG